MDLARAHSASQSAPSFQDGLGDRFLLVEKSAGEALEMLCLREDLTEVPSFEFALRERVSRLANFRHAYYGRVRRVDRVADPSGLAVVYEHTPGARLSEILTVAEREGLPLDINAALFLIRQLVPAIAMLHQNARDVSHGAIAPERIVVTPHARLVVLEYVLGSALEQLHFSHERLWQEFRVAMPASAGLPRFDHRSDVTQLGIVALSLILGRPLRDDEYPRRIADVLAAATELSALGEREPLAPSLRTWLARALQVDHRQPFHSAIEAQSALELVLSEESRYIAAPIALESFLSRYHDQTTQPVRTETPAPKPEPVSRVQPLEPVRPVAARPTAVKVQPTEPAMPEPPRPEPVHAAPAQVFETPQPESVWAHHETEPVINDEEAFEELVEPMPTTPVHHAQLPPEPAKNEFAFDPERLFSPEPIPTPPVKKPAPVPQRSLASRRRRIAIAALGVVALCEGVVISARKYLTPTVPPAAAGVLAVESRPPGAEVVIDGRVRGATPLKLTLPPGPHQMELKAPGGEPRVIPVTIQTGSQVSQYIELGGATVQTGHLQVKTEPAGARVVIDGQPRGNSPITVEELATGDHDVLLESTLGTVRQRVTIQPGTTASLFVPLAGSGAPISGWVAVSAPVEVQIFEGGRLLGTSQSDRIMVSAGAHDIEVVNDTLAFRMTRTVQVPPGRVAAFKVDLPKGVIHLNAIPWAEVWIDGEKVGETPIGNLSVPIGPHEIVFRNPQFAEQHHAATVTLAAPTRLSVDLRK